MPVIRYVASVLLYILLLPNQHTCCIHRERMDAPR